MKDDTSSEQKCQSEAGIVAATTVPAPIADEVIDYRGTKVVEGADYDLNRKISIGSARDNEVVGSMTVLEALNWIKAPGAEQMVRQARNAAEDIADELWDAIKGFRKNGSFDLNEKLELFAWMPRDTFKALQTKLTELYLEYKLRVNWADKETQTKLSADLSKIGWRHAKVWKLPAFMWSGVFGVRTENGMIETSGLMCVDFDNLGEAIEGFMEKLKGDQLIFAGQRSPSLTGVKVEVRIPDDALSDPRKFRACFDTFLRYVQRNYPGVSIGVDKQAKARNQLCFQMYDHESFYFADSYILQPDPDLLESKAAVKNQQTGPKEKQSARSAPPKRPGQGRDYTTATWPTVKSALESLEPYLTGLKDGTRYSTWTGLFFAVGDWAKKPANEAIRDEAKQWLLEYAGGKYGNNADKLANAFDTADGRKTVGSLFALAMEHGWKHPGGKVASSGDALSDPRPKIQLPGANRLLSDFAAELAGLLRDEDIFVRNGEVCVLNDGALKQLKMQPLRTWCEQYVMCFQQGRGNGNTYTFNVTMDRHDALGTLESPQFRAGLRPVRRVHNTRLPFIEADGKLALLPSGYHEPSQSLTLSSADYDLEMSLEDACQSIDDLLAEFGFADDGQPETKESEPKLRSKAVAVSAMVGLYANALLPDNSLRPDFVVTANAEGAGKGTLAKCCMVPALGSVPTGSKPKDEDEMRKTLLTAVREAKPVIFFDNLKGHLASESLEAFLSAPVFEGRKLGVNESIVAPNLATVFITGNGLTVSPDMRRRSLFIELHMAEEKAEDKVFKRPLDDAKLLELRPELLAALWAFVRHWDSKGRPAPSRSHSAFPSWAKIIGGIVEAAGYGCPLETAKVAASADADGDDMRSLVSAMAQRLPGGQGRRAGKTEWTFGELLNLVQDLGLFENILGAGEEGVGIEDDESPKSGFRSRWDCVGRKEKSILSHILVRYERRLVSGEGGRLYRFVVEGRGHARRYAIEPQVSSGI